MTNYLLQRILQSTIVVLITTAIVFFGVNVIGNPVDIFVRPGCDQACYQAAIQTLGLDRPLHEQYLKFLANAISGDLGTSFISGQSALSMILDRLPATLELAVTAVVLAIITGIPLGMWSGLYPDSFSGRFIELGSIFGFSLPAFWVGLMLIMVFSVELGWLPTTGRGETIPVFGIPFSFLTLDGLSHLLLPALNMSLYLSALLTRLTRSGVREVLTLDYIKFAKAKGLGTTRIIFVHVLKNILIPIVTVIGLELGTVIAFAVVTESIFSWPGMGKLIIDSILLLDRPVIVSYIMLAVFLFVLINFIVDLLYSILDPRIRVKSGS